MTALTLDCKHHEFNYDSKTKTMPLKSKRLWEGRWSKKVKPFDRCNSYEKIDLAQKIFGFYKNGYTNLSQCDLIAGTTNEFKFFNK